MRFFLIIVAFCTLISFVECALPTQTDYDELSQTFSCGSFIVTPADSNFGLYSPNFLQTWDDVNIPSSIIMCQCEQDVVQTMKWISDFLDSTSFRIRSGGSSMGGYCKSNNEILIDLSEMKDVNIISKNKICVEPGVELNDYEEWKSLNPSFDGTIPHGLSPRVAFGGYATGGGIGLTGRQWGVTTDYIYGVRVILCDASLWQIIENNKKETKCIEGCGGQNKLKYRDLQDLLYAIKGGGGGNFGIITKYYFNTKNDPKYPMYFDIMFLLPTREDMFSAIISFKNILINDFAKNSDFTISMIIGPGQTPPYIPGVQFNGIYFAKKGDNTIFNAMISKIEEYIGYAAINKIVIETQSLTEIYRNTIFPTHAAHEIDLKMYPSTRLVNKEIFDDDNNIFFNVIADYLEHNLLINPMINTGIINTFFMESLGGKIKKNNKKTSFPAQNRNALAVAEIFFIVPSPLFIYLGGVAKSLRDDCDAQIMSIVGNYKYINYLDDAINTHLNQYYSTREINKLSRIQQRIDPNACFKFELGINDGMEEEQQVQYSQYNDFFNQQIKMNISMVIIIAAIAILSFITNCCWNCYFLKTKYAHSAIRKY